MKTKVTLFILCFNFVSLWSQERYFVHAANGLNVREEASANAAKVGKLPYGALVNIVETTNINYEVTEEGETFQSQWVKVKYENFPYINPKNPTYEWDNMGYVVQYYLEKLNKKHIVTHPIHSFTFYSLYKESIAPYNSTKITSFEEVKKMLTGRLKWSVSPQFEEAEVLDEIYLPNGQTLDIDEDVIDYEFRAYYPSEEIMVFEGGHSSDYSINLKTGETLETTGNPEYITQSPSSKYRLNGWFPGQEIVSYFIQEKTDDGYKFITELKNDFPYFIKFYWVNDGVFIYSYMDYAKKGEGEEKYAVASVTSTENTPSPIPNTFQSELRPNETLELGKTYKDTVKFVEFNAFDYDDRLFTVTKNDVIMVLIFNKDVDTKLAVEDQLEITWKMEGHIPAGDPEYIDFREHLVSYKKIGPFQLKDKKVKALWREKDSNTMVLNQDYIDTMSVAEKAALAYVATFIGSECEWDGKVNESKSNLKCKILSSLGLGYQCSDTHYGFLKKWFSKDTTILKTLESCRTIPNTATVQSTFDEIYIQTDARNQTIVIRYKVRIINVRENSVTKYTKTDAFQYKAGNLTLIDSHRE